MVAQPDPRPMFANAAVITAQVRVAKRVEYLKRNPIEAFYWVPIQEQFLRSDAKIKMLRTGTQSVGKTTAALTDLLWEAMGIHPFLPELNELKGDDFKAWVLCKTFTQSIVIQEKLWELVPEWAKKEGTTFSKKSGFRHHNPTVQILHKPTGTWSTIQFKTGVQDAAVLASATLDTVLCDEPPTEAQYSEALSRISDKKGRMLLALTPAHADTTYLEQLVKEGKIVDFHARLSGAALTPRGFKTPRRSKGGDVMDDAFVAAREHNMLEHLKDIMIHGEWDRRVAGQRFADWNPSLRSKGGMVFHRVPQVNMELLLGIDWGSGSTFNQVFVIVGKARGKYYVLAEYVAESATTMANDADNLMRLMTALGIEWRDLDEAYGDREMKAGSERKDNTKMMKLLRERGCSGGPNIKTVKTGKGRAQGSVIRGETWIHRRMVAEEFLVNKDCTTVIECFSKYDGKKTSAHKHLIDAIRYACNKDIFEMEVGTGNLPRYQPPN